VVSSLESSSLYRFLAVSFQCASSVDGFCSPFLSVILSCKHVTYGCHILQTSQSQTLPDCLVPGLKRGGLGFVYLGLYQIGTLFFPDSYLTGNEFQVNITSDLVYKTVILHCIVHGCEV
jgi:hypothetical protein